MMKKKQLSPEEVERQKSRFKDWQKTNPSKTFIPASDRAQCAYMKVTTLPKVLRSIENNQYPITVDAGIAAPEVRLREGDPVYMAAYDEIQRLEAFHALAHQEPLLAALRSLFGEEVLVHPRNIARVEDSGWEQDFYMTCFHNIRRDSGAVRAGLGDLPVDELYLQGDPKRMTTVVRQVSRPCLGFKILAAGRLCANRASMDRAFQFAYANIKKTDGVIVGMFPILTDEIGEDAAMARKYA